MKLHNITEKLKSAFIHAENPRHEKKSGNRKREVNTGTNKDMERVMNEILKDLH